MVNVGKYSIHGASKYLFVLHMYTTRKHEFIPQESWLRVKICGPQACWQAVCSWGLLLDATWTHDNTRYHKWRVPALALASDSHSLPCKDLASIITAHSPSGPFTQQRHIFVWLVAQNQPGTPNKNGMYRPPETNIKNPKTRNHRTKPPGGWGPIAAVGFLSGKPTSTVVV